MLLRTSTPPPEGLASWPQIAMFCGCTIVGLIATRRFATGWGDGGTRLRRDGRWGVFLARYGFAFMPLTCASAAITLFMVMLHFYIETDVNAFGVIGLGLVLSSGGCVIWAIKEYWRPSRWRRRPAWLDDFERDMGIRR